MKHVFSIAMAIVFLSVQGIAQTLYTTDGMPLGDRQTLVQACIDGAEAEVTEFNGISFDSEKYCSCVIEELMPRLSSSDLLEVVGNEDYIMDLLLNDENLPIIMNCLKGTYNKTSTASSEEPSSISQSMQNEMVYQLSVETCVQELIVEDENGPAWEKQEAEEYCHCAMTRLAENESLSEEDLNALDEMGSDAFMEIVWPCLMGEETSTTSTNSLKENSRSKPVEVEGPEKGHVALSDLNDMGYYIQIGFGNAKRMFLFDTGASNLILNADLERELLLAGFLQREHYLGKETFILADGREVTAQMVLLPEVSFGDYTLRNVEAGIISEGSLLMGKNLLEAFTSWQIDNRESQLILLR